MGFDDDLKRGLRKAAAELETGNEPLRPARAGAKRGVRMRPAAAGLGMAVSIAATVALFAQLLPSNELGGAVRPSAASQSPSESEPVQTPTEGRPSTEPTENPSDDPTGAPTGEPEPSPPTPVPPFGPDPNCGPAPAVFDAYSQFSVTLEVSPASASPGRPFTFGVRLTNHGSDTTYEEGNPRAEVFVYDDRGRVVWVSSSGTAYTQELRTGTYRQGESAEVTHTWQQDGCASDDGSRPAIGPGSYTARARWNGNRGGWSQPVSLEIR